MNLLERLLKKRSTAPKSLEQEQREGNQAAAILRDGIFTQVIDDMRERILANWAESPLRDIEARENMRVMIEMLNKVVKNIEDAYITGELAAKQLEVDRKKKDSKKA